MTQLLSADLTNRGLVLDPRSKLILMLSIVFFTMGGVGSDIKAVILISKLLGLIPIILLLTAKQWKRALAYGGVYAVLTLVSLELLPVLNGGIKIILTICCVGVLRFMPGLIMGAYILSSTTVSEFIAAFHRMRIPNQITIPLSVMFRFFPTVIEEMQAINSAMKMREIRLFGKNAGKLIEYRLIPLLVCSVNIGQELSAAALTRGLCAEKKRTNICRIGFHLQDIMAFVIAVSPAAVMICNRFGVIA